jgi:hypothetical protein
MNPQIARYQKLFLLITSVVLIPIALSYGFIPEGTFKLLYGIDLDASDVNLKNILRGLMGLYLAMVALWIIGAFNIRYRITALYALVIFMFGVAFGRLISFIIDGFPYCMLVFFFLSELMLGSIGVHLIVSKNNKKHDSDR